MPLSRDSRVYRTAADRAANEWAGENVWTGRQRSGSTHYRHRSGNVVREHWHTNAHGGTQFSRPIGGIDRNGKEWGLQPENGYVV